MPPVDGAGTSSKEYQKNIFSQRAITCEGLQEKTTSRGFSFFQPSEFRLLVHQQEKRRKKLTFSLNIYFYSVSLPSMPRTRRENAENKRRQWQPRSETKICHFNMDFLFKNILAYRDMLLLLNSNQTRFSKLFLLVSIPQIYLY